MCAGAPCDGASRCCAVELARAGGHLEEGESYREAGWNRARRQFTAEIATMVRRLMPSGQPSTHPPAPFVRGGPPPFSPGGPPTRLRAAPSPRRAPPEEGWSKDPADRWP